MLVMLRDAASLPLAVLLKVNVPTTDVFSVIVPNAGTGPVKLATGPVPVPVRLTVCVAPPEV